MSLKPAVLALQTPSLGAGHEVEFVRLAVLDDFVTMNVLPILSTVVSIVIAFAVGGLV